MSDTPLDPVDTPDPEKEPTPETGAVSDAVGPTLDNEEIDAQVKSKPPPTAGKRFRLWLKRGLRWAFIGAGALFIALHLWGLALIFLPVTGTINMFLRPAGTELRQDWVPLDRISPHLVTSVIAAEDSRFCQHGGIDFAALEEAIEDNRQGSRRRGGSTLTQQTAKNVFLWNGGGYVRKAIEAYFTLYIDAIWTKRRTLEIYLNIAEWGDGLFGAEAAAQARFGKPAADLTRREAALLAAVLPSPNKWRVDPPGLYVSSRAATLEQRARVVENEGLATCVLG